MKEASKRRCSELMFREANGNPLTFVDAEAVSAGPSRKASLPSAEEQKEMAPFLSMLEDVLNRACLSTANWGRSVPSCPDMQSITLHRQKAVECLRIGIAPETMSRHTCMTCTTATIDLPLP